MSRRQGVGAGGAGGAQAVGSVYDSSGRLKYVNFDARRIAALGI